MTEYRYGGDDADARRRHQLLEIIGPNPDNRVQIEYLPDALFRTDGQRVARLRLGVDGAVAYAYAYELARVTMVSGAAGAPPMRIRKATRPITRSTTSGRRSRSAGR